MLYTLSKSWMDLHLPTSHDNADKWFSKISLKNVQSDDGLYVIETYKKQTIYDKPIYVGTSILDLSKLCMMQFHFDVIETEFKNKYQLLYSDTDSMVYNIQHPDIHDWM